MYIAVVFVRKRIEVFADGGLHLRDVRLNISGSKNGRARHENISSLLSAKFGVLDGNATVHFNVDR